MMHNYLSDNGAEHWAVGKDSLGNVLVQIADADADQARLALDPEAASRFADVLRGTATGGMTAHWCADYGVGANGHMVRLHLRDALCGSPAGTRISITLGPREAVPFADEIDAMANAVRATALAAAGPGARDKSAAEVAAAIGAGVDDPMITDSQFRQLARLALHRLEATESVAGSAARWSAGGGQRPDARNGSAGPGRRTANSGAAMTGNGRARAPSLRGSP